jgi:hypothetical protein
MPFFFFCTVKQNFLHRNPDSDIEVWICFQNLDP